MTFSVIIPVYNTPEAYLRECIDSVLGQTYNNIELIIVNDGSTNSETLRILNDYSNNTYNSKTLKFHHKENGGQSSAKNVGIAIATGDYVLFLDSDDYYMSCDFFNDISDLLEDSQADLLSFQYVEFYDEHKRPIYAIGDLPREKVFNQSTDAALKALLRAPKSVFSSVTHTKALKISFLRDNNITMIEELAYAEDISLTASIIYHAKTFDRYNYAVYAFRRTNTASITRNIDNSLKLTRCILLHFDLLLSNNNYKNNLNILDFLASPYVYWLGKVVAALNSAEKSQKEQIKEDLKVGLQYSYILQYSSRPYVRAIGVLINIFGIRFVMFLLKIFLTLNKKHTLSISRKVS